MAKRVKIVADTLLSEGRFRLTRTEAEIEEADGSHRRVDYEIYRHGGAAALLLYDPARRVVLMVRQFRLGAYLADGALETIEVCAGMLDGDDPETCVRREALEETGVRVGGVRHAFDAYMSPGGVTETVACFVAPYRVEDRIGAGGGVDADEKIEVIEATYEQAAAMIAGGEIRDAKTIALLSWARAERWFESAVSP